MGFSEFFFKLIIDHGMSELSLILKLLVFFFLVEFHGSFMIYEVLSQHTVYCMMFPSIGVYYILSLNVLHCFPQ